jgi:DNA modification methylase
MNDKGAKTMKIRDRVKELRRVRAGDLLPNPKNWRTHPASQADALKGILAEVGYADALLARELPDGTLMLVDGHLRAETTPELEVPVLILDVNEAEADKLLLSLDPLAALAETNAIALDSLLREVDTGSEGLQQMYADLAEAAKLYEGETAEVVEDEVPEPPVDPITKPGDLWTLGDHRLLCGDSTKAEDVERLMAGGRINVAFTSPPYASQREYDQSSGFKPIAPDDFVDWWEPIQEAVKNHLTDDGSFFVNIKPACEDLERLLYVFDLVVSMKRKWGWLFAEEFCWERNGIPQQVVRRFKNQFEPVYQFCLGEWKFRPKDVRHQSESVPVPLGKGAGNTNAAKRQGNSGAVDPNEIAAGLAYPGNRLPTFSSTHQALGHSAAFPVGLPSFFIQAYTDKGDNVYEPFCGSGSTLIAAEQLGRKCYGMEISPQYCDVIVKRWETLTGKKAVLEVNDGKARATQTTNSGAAPKRRSVKAGT